MGLGQQGMQRGSDGRRLNVKQRALNDAFSNIFPERASFELRDDDVEALRKQLQKDDSIDIALQELQQRQRDAAETAAWKVIIKAPGSDKCSIHLVRYADLQYRLNNLLGGYDSPDLASCVGFALHYDHDKSPD